MVVILHISSEKTLTNSVSLEILCYVQTAVARLNLSVTQFNNVLLISKVDVTRNLY